MMRPFRFRLETVRRLRDHEEQRARDNLARELAAHSAATNDLRRRIEAVNDARSAAQGADVVARAAWDVFIEHKSREQQLAATALVDQQLRVEDQRVALGHASREHKAVARLEDKHRARHREEQQRREEHELSDIASRAHGRLSPGAAA
jgi:flagellar protein FliJ